MVELQYFGHSFFKLKDKNGTILIDPIFSETKTNSKKIGKLPAKKTDFKDVSLILLTSEMEDHFDKEAVLEIALKNNAVVVANDFILTGLNLPRTQKASVMPSSEIFLKGFKIKTMTSHCPQCFCPTGFVIDFGKTKLYHAGTTALLESFSEINADIALLPMSNKTMDVVDVVRAAKIIKPKTLIPMQHETFDYGFNEASDLKRRIEESVLKTETIVLKPGKKMKF